MTKTYVWAHAQKKPVDRSLSSVILFLVDIHYRINAQIKWVERRAKLAGDKNTGTWVGILPNRNA